MKLTQKTKGELQGILNDLQRAEKFLLKPETVLATETNLSGAKDTTWINSETGKTALAFNKHVGNDLCYLNNSIQNLANFLTAHE